MMRREISELLELHGATLQMPEMDAEGKPVEPQRMIKVGKGFTRKTLTENGYSKKELEQAVMRGVIQRTYANQNAGLEVFYYVPFTSADS